MNECYYIQAINEAARIEADTELVLEMFAPKAPSNLTANSTRSAISVRWIQNYIRPDIKFSVWYRKIDSLEWRQHQVTSRKYETTIENLEPGKEYELMILSQDRYNDGLFSRAFRYRLVTTYIYGSSYKY